ncbi:hypothetical protein [Salinicola aestuarinus]|uniref:hypothetical protein n=1 Tax=Salinicola aestuarinus TaxID=1949082 RepID=UPI001FD892FE|nr:hypothetical protein [Salinicola aestuarinus]
MPIDARYHEQVSLLVSLLPFLNAEPGFALQGGTAISPLTAKRWHQHAVRIAVSFN